MKFKEIRSTYESIFESYGGYTVAEHINKIIELDAILPYNSTFFCVTNTQKLTFEYISKNMTSCLGHDVEKLKEGGMRYFWKFIHPDDIDYWLKALNQLMEYTLDEIPEEKRNLVSYTWNYRIRNSKDEYVNIVQNTTPLEFDMDKKPIIGLAHYTVLNSNRIMDVCASAKMFNPEKEYETIYFNNFSKKLISDGISNRERDIIRLLVLKLSSKEIAKRLCISHNTVDTHRRNILKKLNISTTGELVGMINSNKIQL